MTPARPDVIARLHRLPDREFRQVRELWKEMTALPNQALPSAWRSSTTRGLLAGWPTTI
ncbi:hypothetical protein [Micromonospora sp. LOL_024]|uniref:hypothetical protein n=1 Tax=Micromonospora sp. LOL_024 TaxID=3345412 RepID=UPI003A856C98